MSDIVYNRREKLVDTIGRILVTMDVRLARASGIRASVEVYG